MCPFCLSTIGLMLAGTVSTGGLTALALKISSKNRKTNPDTNLEQGECNDHQNA